MNSDNATQTGPTLTGISDLVRKLIAAVPAMAGTARADLERHFQRVLQEQMAKLDLCSRTEFEAQARALARTHEKLTQLEAAMTQLEARLRNPPT
jgi:BMFP domain-containing protein YqiC